MAGTPVTQERKNELLEECFNCYCAHGIASTGLKALAAACGVSTATLLFHFGSVDNIIVQSTAYCMAKVEDEFMAKAPTSPDDIERFIKEIPYWTTKHHGAKYRFMYQVYASPKYLEHGREFFRGVTERYTAYAKQLEPKTGISWQMLQPLIFSFVRAVVHFAMFGEEEYLQSQLRLIANGAKLIHENQYIFNHTTVTQEESK